MRVTLCKRGIPRAHRRPDRCGHDSAPSIRRLETLAEVIRSAVRCGRELPRSPLRTPADRMLVRSAAVWTGLGGGRLCKRFGVGCCEFSDGHRAGAGDQPRSGVRTGGAVAVILSDARRCCGRRGARCIPVLRRTPISRSARSWQMFSASDSSVWSVRSSTGPVKVRSVAGGGPDWQDRGDESPLIVCSDGRMPQSKWQAQHCSLIVTRPAGLVSR
jgi:hypothetical protein